MHTVSLFDAKTHLSRLVEDLVSGKEDEIVISRHGKPAVRVMPLRRNDVSKRLGLARGRFKVPANIDRANDAIARLFLDQRRRA
jgi:prevent-host-death family protein